MMLAWHYTTGLNFAKIMASGELRPTSLYVTRNERPVLWFSAEQDWEPTAAKVLYHPQDRSYESLTRWKTLELGRGLVRIGIEPQRLIPWPRLANEARIPPAERARMVRSGIAKGATPTLWLGKLGTLSIGEWRAVEYWPTQSGQAGQWERVEDPASLASSISSVPANNMEGA